ncbi:DUF3772 domain-containing protein [Sphingomonas nostoxanthinifaciens]|uniref:DUF3772 domain-containing protein n=1 Tax=Sphingomonas nostoxanthinifaciens TaxID=2872652 RepID=UPI001CC2188B|nr:DUF3772 domain-containing protein [Sphingomonas nostoxanthinifaciens]UAK22847.1 DUF3772 domain-containing protein [Sphingomonas nostoxanthinifaciens]
MKLITLPFLLILAAAPAFATNPRPAVAAAPHSIAALAGEVDRADAQSQSIAIGARLRTIDDAGLRSRLAAIPEIQAELDDALASLEPRLQSADARLAGLGVPPGPGQPSEDPEIAQERQTILRFRRSVDTEVKQAKLVGIEVKQLQDYLTTRRRDLFNERLWQRDSSPLDYRFWGQTAAAMPQDITRAAGLTAGRRTSPQTSSTATWSRWLAVLLLAAALLVPSRTFLIRWARSRAERSSSPTRLRRAALALWIAGVAACTALLACLILRNALEDDAFSDIVLGAVAPAFTRALVFASLFAGLGRALLSPRAPAWRLAPLADDLVDRAKRYPPLVGAIVALGAFLLETATALQFSEQTSAAIRCFTNLADVAVITAALSAVTRGELEGSHGTDAVPAETRRVSRLPWALAMIGAWMSIAVTFGATLLGYNAFGGLIIREMIWVATVLALLFLLVNFVDEIFPALLSPHSRVGRMLRSSLSLPPASFAQAGVLLSGFARIALLLFGWTAMLAPFGPGAEGMFGRLTSSAFVFQFGQVEISPGTILIGFLVFLVGLAATRGVRRWLEARYLPTTSMDIGAQTALGAGISYLGAIVAITVASAYLGLSLDKITLLASALSVGIGFGLQSIISNFVSGLILLAERPIRIGDWIAIGDLEGDVRKISVRATEIEMRDRSKLIVPNSDLISKTVRNVTHGSAPGRLKIVLNVNDTADPALVRDLIGARLVDHADIIADPAPNVFLTDVRDGGLEFTALAYVASAREAYRIKSELLFQIVPDLRKNGIALASSTPVVNVGLADRTIEPGDAARGPAATS